MSTLFELEATHKELCGRRNGLYLERTDRLFLLNGAAIDFCNVDRLNAVDQKNPGSVLASVLSSLFTLADDFPELPHIEAFTKKYPSYGCFYCEHMPCICTPSRKSTKKFDFATAPLDPEQLNWSTSRRSQHMDDVYGQKNAERGGLSYIAGRLLQEVCELQQVCAFELRNPQCTSSHAMNMLLSEFADCHAWTHSADASIGYVLDSTFVFKYGNLCKWCGKRPCECSAFQRR